MPKLNNTRENVFAVDPVHIQLKNLSVVGNVPIFDSKNTRAIMSSFGIKGESIKTMLVPPMDLAASTGNIIFISGPSGSGKSILLNALDPNFSDDNLIINHLGSRNASYTVGWMNEIKSKLPLIDFFAKKYGLENSIAALNRSGLSEVFIYLKPYKFLSRGQKYRAKMAQLILSKSQVWLIDEFCSDLDPTTAKIVANNLRKCVIKYDRIAFIAAANHKHYIRALRPTYVIKLLQGADTQTLRFKEYLNELYDE